MADGRSDLFVDRLNFVLFFFSFSLPLPLAFRFFFVRHASNFLSFFFSLSRTRTGGTNRARSFLSKDLGDNWSAIFSSLYVYIYTRGYTIVYMYMRHTYEEKSLLDR